MEREKYVGISDEELILRYRDGEEEAIDYLINKYKNLVRKKAGSMFLIGGDHDDLIQEGMLGMFKAVRDYDVGRDVNFFTFADLCVSRQIYTAVQASNRKKHLPLNTYISIYGQVSREEEGEGESPIFLNRILGTQEENPEEMVLAQERLEDIEAAIEQELSSFERKVFELHLTGMTYTEIAKVLGRDEKSTDNALQRIKVKIRKIIRD
ncbi:MAG: RNA polymerase sporulation sigma factor SigH [Lachnospiraceae bacterium]|nr:RNA polymerase sporulation sigma factor SigH [Lachnospiraceae bacterium]